MFLLYILAIIQQDEDSGASVGAIVGGIFGAVAFLIIVFISYKLFQRRR